MKLDDLLPKMFPSGQDISRGPDGTLSGTAKVSESQTVRLLGLIDGTPLGADNAISISRGVIDLIAKGDKQPLVLLVDGHSQKWSRRDEMLGLNEYLGHLCKCLSLASQAGILTVSVLYGRAEGGALIAACLSPQVFVAIDGATPSVMDLKSIASVTKLPTEKIVEMSKATPIFAPGVDHLAVTGAIFETWKADDPLSERLLKILQSKAELSDRRDQLGLERKGRLMAAPVSERVSKEAQANA